MSTLDTNSTRLSDDDRYELANRAQNQQRVNSPRHFVVFGIILLMVAIVILASAWRSQSSAIKQNQQAARKLVEVQNAISNIRALEAQSDSATENKDFDPIPGILSKIEGLGSQANLKNPIKVPQQGERVEGEAILKSYSYTNINEPSLEKMLDWVRLAEQEIPGLHVREITIKPRQQYWSMDVVLGRYERRP